MDPIVSLARLTPGSDPLQDDPAAEVPSEPAPGGTPHAGDAFHALLEGIRAPRGPALARLAALITRLLQERSSGLHPRDRTELLGALMARIVARIQHGELNAPSELIAAIDAEATSLGLPCAAAPSDSAWLTRLMRGLPELEPMEREVLAGLYLHALSPAQLASHLDILPGQVEEARRRGLHRLRAVLGILGG